MLCFSFVLLKPPYVHALLEYLHPYFEHKHYVMHPGAMQFKRATRFGHSSIICNLSSDGALTWLTFHLGLRHDLVERAQAGLFGKSDYYQSESHTLMIDSRWIQNPGATSLPERMRIGNHLDLELACDAFIDFMDRSGFAFLDKFRSLSALDKLFNNNEKRAALWCNHHYQRCFRAMAIAQITNRADKALLHQKHRNYLESRGYRGEILHKFDAQYAHMQKLSLN